MITNQNLALTAVTVDSTNGISTNYKPGESTDECLYKQYYCDAY